MSSKRDKDYHKLRNPEKYDLDLGSYHKFSGVQTKEGAEQNKRYEKIHKEYGFKSMVGNKRRRNSTRKSNQKDRQTIHQLRRAQEKEQVRLHLQDDSNITEIKKIKRGILGG